MPDKPDDLTDLIQSFMDHHAAYNVREYAKEQFRAQLIRVIDERVAIALEKRFPVTGDGNHPNPFSATNTAGTFYAMEHPIRVDAPGMYDPRNDRS